MTDEANAKARFWIGPSGWSYRDWVGVVYPSRPPRGFRPLPFIAQRFRTVEINSTFYRTPTPATAAGWAAQVPADFRFAVKLTRALTHERRPAPEEAEAAKFREALAPLKETQRLGPLLLQFPWSFRYTSANVDWLRRLRDLFAGFERVIEVRHASWSKPAAVARLRECGTICNIDQPALRDCLGPSTHASSIAYVRLHGRNAADWFAEGIPAYQRYNYLYSEEELREWAPRLNALADEARDVYVFANNHYRGQGVVNALELRAMVEGARVTAPQELLAAYPRLRGAARTPQAPGLFDGVGRGEG